MYTLSVVFNLRSVVTGSTLDSASLRDGSMVFAFAIESLMGVSPSKLRRHHRICTLRFRNGSNTTAAKSSSARSSYLGKPRAHYRCTDPLSTPCKGWFKLPEIVNIV